MYPKKKQWKSWSLPSKLTVIGTYVGVLSLLITIFIFIYTQLIREDIEEIKTVLKTNIIDNKEKFILGSENEILFGGLTYDNFDPKKYPDEILHLNYQGSNSPDYAIIGLDHPNGIKIRAYHKSKKDENIGVQLPNDFTIGFGLEGELKKGSYLQICEYDFDNDRIPEIIIGIKNELDIQINVIRFHPPVLEKDFIREENWEIIGSFEGFYPTKAFISNSTVCVWYGSQGLYTEYTHLNNKFIQTSEY